MGRRVALSIFAAALCQAAQAQAPGIPRTPDGRPDFQGMWESRFVVVQERVEGATALVVSDAEAEVLAERASRRINPVDPLQGGGGFGRVGPKRVLPRVGGEWRSSFLTEPADGKMPITAEGRRLTAERQALARRPVDDPEMRFPSERCIAGPASHPPMGLVMGIENIRQIVQTKTHIVVYSEEDGRTRIVPIGSVTRSVGAPTTLGESSARWDGDVLVIETVNMSLRPATLIVTRPQGKVIERLSFVSPGQILYRYTIEDAEIYDRPWSAEYPLNRSGHHTMEFACHEGNYSLSNMLKAAREGEKRAEEKGKP